MTEIPFHASKGRTRPITLRPYYYSCTSTSICLKSRYVHVVVVDLVEIHGRYFFLISEVHQVWQEGDMCKIHIPAINMLMLTDVYNLSCMLPLPFYSY